jgi:hypothetical protein
MKSDTPFNPLPLPDGLLLSQETEAGQPAGQDPGQANPKAPPRRKAKRKSRGPRKPGPQGADTTAETRWNRLKGRINTKLAQIDPDTLKRILTAAGVAAGVIIAILIAIKLTPVALVLLGLLGLAFLLRLWDRLRYFPRPF